MTYPPPGGTPDPYQPQQPHDQQPYGQQPTSGASDPYQQHADPYGTGAPSSGQPYGQQPYGAPGYPGAPYNPTTNVMAILSLVFAFVFSPVAIVLGHMAKKQIRERGEQGEGLATAGLVLGYIFTGIGVVICAIYAIVIVAAIGSSGASTY